ncbi:hypothetical protein RRF57_004585 [Xylaria bambusicola]|uniref:Aflatoxin regulatory protein domain-containing protein n=1 Tax=Xylaria bambusicola TaxID=326684 RepID=A0AAN7UAW0_9PEZI
MGMGRRPAEADTDPFSGGIFNLNESFSDRIGDYLLGSPNLSLPVADETFSLHPFPVAAPLSTTNQETRASNGHEAAEGYDMGISEQVSATCSCSSQIVVTFEMVEISLHLVTAPKGSPGRPSQAAAMNIEEFLRDHKRALVSCEMLLGCETCSCRGEYVMLVISICRKLLHSVGVMHREGLSEVQNRDSSRERGGLWKLDDEDQAGVLEVLLKIRATRLRRLVTILDHVVTSHDWPAHRSMTQDLVRRLAEA